MKELTLFIILLVRIIVGFFALGLTVYGIYLSFVANFVLGLLSLFLHPITFFVGAVQFLFGKNIAEACINWINSL